MKFTRKGYGQLRRADDTFVSQHTVAEEAYERASREGPGVYTWHPARIEIEVPAAAAPVYDPATRRIYVSGFRCDGDYPMIYVFEV